MARVRGSHTTFDLALIMAGTAPQTVQFFVPVEKIATSKSGTMGTTQNEVVSIECQTDQQYVRLQGLLLVEEFSGYLAQLLVA